MSSSKKKRRVSGDELPKQGTIRDFFAKQLQVGKLPSPTAVLEVPRRPKLVPDIFLEEALKVHETYREQQGAASDAIAAISGLRRSSRQRQRSRRLTDDTGSAAAALAARRPAARRASASSSDSDEEAGPGSDAEGAGGGGGEAEEDEEEAYSRALCERWQGHATSFIQQVSKWVSPNWMLPLQVQECLVHFVANHELHTTDPALSMQALRMLQQIATHHPHAAFLAADDDLPARLASHDELWHPMVKDSTLTGRIGASGFQLLQRLVAGALELAVGPAAAAAAAPGGGVAATHGGGGSSAAGSGADAGGSAQVGAEGRALLLHYVATVLQADLAVRLRVWREARQQDDGGARAGETVLQSALLWRLLQDDNSWSGIRGDKVHLVRSLAMMAVARRGTDQDAVVRPRRSQGGSGGGDDTAVPSLLRIESLRTLGARLLRLMLALLGAAEDAGLYSESARQRVRAQGANDRMQMDKALMGVLAGNDVPPALKHPLTKADLLAVLPGRDRVRLIALLVAEQYSRSWKAKHPCEHLEALHAYAFDQGKGAAAFVGGDAGAVASYLADHYAWAAKALGAGLPANCPMLAASLLLGAAEEADARAAEAAAAAKARGGAAASGGSKGGARGGRGRQQERAAEQAAGSKGDSGFPAAAARRLLDAVRAAEGWGDARDVVAAAEAAVLRFEEGGTEAVGTRI